MEKALLRARNHRDTPSIKSGEIPGGEVDILGPTPF